MNVMKTRRDELQDRHKLSLAVQIDRYTINSTKGSGVISSLQLYRVTNR